MDGQLDFGFPPPARWVDGRARMGHVLALGRDADPTLPPSPSPGRSYEPNTLDITTDEEAFTWWIKTLDEQVIEGWQHEQHQSGKTFATLCQRRVVSSRGSSPFLGRARVVALPAGLERTLSHTV